MGEAGLSELAGVVGAAGVVLALLARRRVAFLAGFGLIALAEVLLADPGGVSPGLAAAALAGVVVLAAAATVFVRYPALVVPALLLAAPFRLPFDFDREHRFLFALAEGGRLGRLVPLYVVLAAAVAAALWSVTRGVGVAPVPRVLAVPAAAFFGIASLSLLWSRDLGSGVNLLAFFLLPFAALVAVVARAELAPWLPKALA
jgi:FtsH-binding integral membrane protein